MKICKMAQETGIGGLSEDIKKPSAELMFLMLITMRHCDLCHENFFKSYERIGRSMQGQGCGDIKHIILFIGTH